MTTLLLALALAGPSYAQDGDEVPTAEVPAEEVPGQATPPDSIEPHAPAEQQPGPAAWQRDYDMGFTQGRAAGADINSTEFLGYGAAAGCVQCLPGAIAMPIVAAKVKPTAWRPLHGQAVPNADTIPVPPGVNADAYVDGYMAGWIEAVQKKRATNAAIGGGAVVAAYASVYVIYIGAMVVAFMTL